MHHRRISRTRDKKLAIVHVRRGEVAAAGSWIYAWVRVEGDRRVVYTGATGVPPEMRAWLHLHDPNPDVGRIAARYSAASEDSFDVIAVRIPEDVLRNDAKQVLTMRLAEEGLLSEHYVGEVPEHGTAMPPKAARQIERILAYVREHVGR